MSSESPKPLILPLFANTVKSEWSWKRLDNIAEVYDCPHSTPQIVDDHAAPFVVRSQDVRTGTILLENTARVSLETYKERIKRVEPRFGDLVYSREGTYFGIAAEVPRGIKVCLGQRMVLIRPNASIINHAFLKYWLNSPLIFGHIHGFRDGTVAERLNLPVIRGLAVASPTLTEQREIAEVLSALDDRIALLRETNTTLEAIAQALFKSWFVDFDPVRAKQEGREPEGMDADTAALFPDSFEESELGLVPKGWRVGNFGDFITRLSVGKKYDNKTALPEGNVPILDQGKSGIIGFHNDPPSVKASLDAPIVVFANHTCYMRSISYDFSAIQNVLPFVGKDVDTVWAYYATKDRVKFSEYKGHWPDFAIEKAVIPNGSTTIAFRETTDPLIRRIRFNELQAQTLTTLRDTLLPRLISGQLRLPDAKALIEEAAA